MTEGAIMPVSRRPATKVVVFQWPRGTPDLSRWPRSARPRSRAMLVDAPVSSRKTSLSGSRSSWPANHASRRFRMSGRSCSSACADFFECQAGSVEEGPDRADARLEAPLRREALLHLDKADVVLRLDQAEQEVAMGIELRASRLALRARRALSGLARPAHPDDRGSDPDPEADRSLPGRHARQRRINHTNSG